MQDRDAGPDICPNPFVSIVIPTFNPGNLLEETLASCCKIKGIEIEILLIDDGSTDGTPERLARAFPSVRLHRLDGPSGSGAAGRNAGLALAKGRYIKFLDHDDLIQPRGIRAECLQALHTDADMVMARWGVVPIEEKGVFCKAQRKFFSPPDPARLTEAILNGELTPCTASVLYKRSYIAAERWDAAVAIIDDFDWFCRMAIKGGTITTVDTLAYYWLLHPNSIQGRSKGDATIYQKLTFSRARVYQKIEQQLLEQGELTPTRKRLLARRFYTYLRCYARYDRRGCLQLLARIYRLDPDFLVDESLEPDAKALWLIRRIGLGSFLRGYGLSRRWADAIVSAPRRLSAVQVPDKG
jgi:glycosyltransferase involved in cell wall biosynthesis